MEPDTFLSFFKESEPVLPLTSGALRNCLPLSMAETRMSDSFLAGTFSFSRLTNL